MSHRLVIPLVLIIVAGIVGAIASNSAQIPAQQTVPPSPSPTQQQTGLANPASVNCKKVGGTTVIQTRGDGGQYGLCQFQDNYACEEWALLRGNCPKGGVRTTGFDTIEQKYCAWVGGQTLAIKNAKCTFSDGTVCSDEAVYNGTCQPSYPSPTP